MDDYLADCKAKGSKKRKRSGQYTNSNPLIKFVRKHVSRLNYGTKVPGFGVRPELATDRLIDHYNHRRFGAALKNDQFLDHFAGKTTHYFWADHTANTPETLVMIDGDCGEVHGGGTTARFWDRLLPHLDAAFNYARWLTRSEVDAQDVVQDAYVRAFKFFASFRGDDARSWLLTQINLS